MTDIDRNFSYNSVNEYYTNTVLQIKNNYKTYNVPKLMLQKTEFNYNGLVADFTYIRKMLRIKFTNIPFVWEIYINSLSVQDAINVVIYRYYIFSLCMIHIGYILNNVHTLKNWNIKKRSIFDISSFNILNNTFTVIGSKNLTSDLDVTIQGPNSTFVISVIEDLFQLVNSNIPLKSMDIEFYGDFRILKNMYVNVGKFSDKSRINMLKYAYISYFRSTHKMNVNEVSTLVRSIGQKYLNDMESSTSLDEILNDALSFLKVEIPNGLDREKFYKYSIQAENDSKSLTSDNTCITSNSISCGSLADEIFFLIANGNIHRPESYIVPSTAVHVVDLEQGGKSINVKNNSFKTWFTRNVSIGLDNYAFYSSAIEQCGYLEHYAPTGCTKKGIKYLGRMIRALIKSGVLDQSAHVNNKSYNNIQKSTNTYRKDPITLSECSATFNIPAIINRIQTNLGTTGGTRKRSKRKKHYNKSRKRRK